MQPRQLITALINETFRARRSVVAIFVLVNMAMLALALVYPRGYQAWTTILVDDHNIVQPLMQGAAVPTEITDFARNAREALFGRKIMDRILEIGGWLRDHPSDEEQEHLIDAIKKRTKISTVGRNLIRIEYRDDEAERAFKTTQELAALLIQASIAAKAAESKSAYEFIDKQTREYQEKLTDTEAKLRDVRSANLEARAGTLAEVTTRMNALQVRIEQAQQELKEAEIRSTGLERQLSGEVEVTAAATRESQYRGRIADLQTKLDALRLNYHEGYPDIVHIKHQIQDLTNAIDAERARRERLKKEGHTDTDQAVLNNPIYLQLRRELSQNQLNIEALKGRIKEDQHRLEQEAARAKLLHAGDAQLAELTRDYQVNRDIYQDLLRRRENARVSMNLDSEHQGLMLKIQEPATLPLQPIGLRFWHFVVGGVILGALLPVGLIFARMQIDPRVRMAEVISDALGVPVVAAIPHMWSGEGLRSLRRELVLLTFVVVATVCTSASVSLLRIYKVL